MLALFLLAPFGGARARCFTRVTRRTESEPRWSRSLPDVKTGIVGRICSSLVNVVYYPLIVKDKKFYAEDTCSGCGLCVKKCPLNNITVENGKPVWHGNCTHCMACISYCPVEAIEYGNRSKGKRRYKL